MVANYNINSYADLLIMKNHEENENRHQCDTLVINKDITQLNTKKNLDEIKNNVL